MSRCFTIKGENYFEIVLQREDEITCVQYEGKREAIKGRNDYELFVLPEYQTYGYSATKQLLDYYNWKKTCATV